MMSLFTTIFIALPLAFATPLVPRSRSGEITYYAPGLGACGRTNSGGDMIVAVSASRYDSSSLCGKRIRVTGPKGTVNVKVVDRCAGCAPDDLDLSPTAFKKAVGELGLGRVRGTWDFA